MPQFPRLVGTSLPKVLNPFNPLHYIKLLNWTFFKASEYKQYLYQADKEFWLQEGKGAWKYFNLPAFRNMSVMGFVLTPVMSVLLTFLTLFLSERWEGEPRLWVSGLCLGLVMGLISGMGMGLNGNVAWAIGPQVGLLVGLELLLGGVLNFWVLLPPARSLVLPLGIALGFLVGAARLPFYLIQWGMTAGAALFPKRRSRRPGLDDELMVLPFPGLDRQLGELLAQDLPAGMAAVRYWLRNPFQRWAPAKALARRWKTLDDPLPEFYRMAAAPELDEYIVEPLAEGDLLSLPAARAVWLGEAAGVYVDESGGKSRGLSRWVWRLTRSLRGEPDPRLAPLARLFLSIVDETQVAHSGVDRGTLEAAAQAVRSLPYGAEAAFSLTTLVEMAGVEDLTAVVDFQRVGSELEALSEPFLHPDVAAALRDFSEAAAGIAAGLKVDAPAEERESFDLISIKLNRMVEAAPEGYSPEWILIKVAAQRWQRLIFKAIRGAENSR